MLIGTARGLMAAVGMVPLILVVVFLAPTWLAWPLLSDGRRQDSLSLVAEFVKWTRAARS